MSTFHIQDSEDAEDTEINEDLQRVIEDYGTFYRKSSIRPLTEFQKRVNEAAIDMCMKKPRLMRELKRGDLLEMARKKVAEDGFLFKKGKSRSKVYGTEATSSERALKRPKLDEGMRQQRLSEIEENLERLSRQVCIKEKRITQAESVRNYKLCDDLLEDIGEIRGKKRELEREKALLEAKDKRAKRRKMTTSSSTSPVPLSSPVLVGPNTPPVFISPRSSGGYLSDSKSESLRSHTRERSMSDPESPLFQPLCSVPKVIEVPSETSECEKSDHSF